MNAMLSNMGQTLKLQKGLHFDTMVLMQEDL